jgi:hypothetical protein
MRDEKELNRKAQSTKAKGVRDVGIGIKRHLDQRANLGQTEKLCQILNRTTVLNVHVCVKAIAQGHAWREQKER